jgi:hypothetical protein
VSELPVDYHYFVVETKNKAHLFPDEVPVPGPEVVRGQLGSRVAVYPRLGLAAPVRSDYGPNTVMVEVCGPGVSGTTMINGQKADEWIGEVEFADTRVTVSSVPGAPRELTNLLLPSRRLRANIAWYYRDEPESPDGFWEMVKIELTPSDWRA